MQELTYRNQEADAFFERSKKSIPDDKSIRPNKEAVYLMLEEVEELKNKKILEVGCFIGDLLNKLNIKDHSEVYGIEPSLKACNYAKENYNLDLENTTFDQSQFFGFDKANKNLFDIVIIEDVLTWVSREIIMQVLASIDWCLKPGGILFIKDFCPEVDYCYKNIHVKNSDVYSYKVASGHKKYFLDSGMYFIETEQITNTTKFQVSKTNRPDSSLWSYCILRKVSKPLHPILSMQSYR